MIEQTGRKELERRLAQVRRLSLTALDPLTKRRLTDLIRDIEEQLGKQE